MSNLLSILGAATGRDPKAVADDYELYGPLKADTAEAVVEMLRPVQERYAALIDDPSAIGRILDTGAGKARTVASATLDRAHRAVGLLPPG